MDPADGARARRQTPPRGPGDGPRYPSVIGLADALLWMAARPDTVAVLLEPGEDGHDMFAERPRLQRGRGFLPADVGDAVVARLALLAGVDLAAEGEQVGRVIVECEGQRRELVVMVGSRFHGLAAEVRRVLSREDALARDHELAAVSLPVPGARLGSYRVLREIGRGAVGVVYRGEHTVLQKPAAIKVLRPEVARSSEPVVRFVNEARIASRLRHPGLVPVTDFGTTEEGLAYLVMELVEWPTLTAVLGAGALEPARAVALCRRMAEALDAAHESGVVHRDLKPANIFVGPNDQVKIGDFGAAKLVRPPAGTPSDTLRGVYVGTPLYTSPEHAGGVSTDRRADVYSLGCILFEMLTGGPPFRGGTALELVIKHASEAIPIAAHPHGPLPAVVQRTVRRAMAKEPSERYQTARELLADLARCAEALVRKGWRAWLPT